MRNLSEHPSASPVQLATGTLQTPLGEMIARASDRGVQELLFATVPPRPLDLDDASVKWVEGPVGEGKVLQHLELLLSELTDYFGGTRADFQVALDLQGTTFQKQVWHELVQIDWGSSISYGELACRISRPSAVRAVAQANARNPVCIVVPCHRVIAHDGTLSGYAGGPWRKRWMLDLESK